MHIRPVASTATKADNEKFVRFSQNANAMGKLSRMHQADWRGDSLFRISFWSPAALNPL